MNGITFSASGGNIAEDVMATVVMEKASNKEAQAKSMMASATEAFDDFKSDMKDLIETYEYQVSSLLEMVRDLVNRMKSQNLWDDISVMTEKEEIEKYVKDAEDYGFDDYKDEKEMVEDLMDEIDDFSEELATYNTIMLSKEGEAIKKIAEILEKA